MNYLKEANVSDETFAIMIEENGKDIIDNLYMSSENMIKVINYLRLIGVKVIDELLYYEISIFTIPYEDVISKFDKVDIKETVYYINEDYVYIENILYN